MKKISYYIARLFFSKEKLLLIGLLNEIQDSLVKCLDGSYRMRYSGMCSYIQYATVNNKDYNFLKNILYVNKPEKLYEDGRFFFEPYNYEFRYEFLKELIKKY